jgi:hypothetical protein
VIGIDRLRGEKVIVFCPIRAFIGNNPRQSAICSLRDTSTQPNHRKCLRQRYASIHKLWTLQKIEEHALLSNLKKILSSKNSLESQKLAEN